MTDKLEKPATGGGSAAPSCYTNFYCFELSPIAPTSEEAEEMASPRGMRSRIERYSEHDTLTRSCFNIASANNCDVLDSLTIIAFQALSENQRLKEQLVKQVHERPAILMSVPGV